MSERGAQKAALDGLTNPKSVAIVGVSERPAAIGTRVLKNLRMLGYAGAIYPVNPRYEKIGDLKCWPSLSALPCKVDAAFLAVPAAAGPELAEEAGRLGIKALFLNASGYADGGAEGIALQRRLEEIAARHGIVLAGPNNLGLVNVHDRMALWTQQYMKPVTPGPVGVISQSGSIALMLIEDERDLGFAYLVTTGNEAGATVADYLYQMAEDDRVKVILLFLETIRDPELFTAATAAAVRRGKRIIALKVGASAGGQALVQAHTGSLAGEDKLYAAYFKALGIIRVRDLDEMIETAVLFCANPALPPSAQIAVVTLSGGEATLLADIGNELGMDFMALGPATLARLRPAFPGYATICNPVDAWGLGFNEERFQLVVDALLADPALGTVAFSVDAPARRGEDVYFARAIAHTCLKVKTDKRIVFVNITTGNGVNAAVRKLLDPAGIAYLSGMRAGLAALRNMIQLRRTAPVVLPATAVNSIEDWPREEPARFRLLSAAGVPMVPAKIVDDRNAAVSAAELMGWPVAMKGVADHLPHKSEHGLVRLNLVDRQAVERAFDALQAALMRLARAGSHGQIVVQKMAHAGVELILGIRNEPGFGSFVIVGPGGVLAELGNQASMRLGPVDATQAREMLEETAAATLLKGVRGQGPWDMAAAASAIAAFSCVGASYLETLITLEINPLIVGRHGVAGVDVLAELQK